MPALFSFVEFPCNGLSVVIEEKKVFLLQRKICAVRFLKNMYTTQIYRKQESGENIWGWAFNLQYRLSFFVILLIWLQLRTTRACIIYIYVYVWSQKRGNKIVKKFPKELSRRRRTTMIGRRKQITRRVYLYIYLIWLILSNISIGLSSLKEEGARIN